MLYCDLSGYHYNSGVIRKLCRHLLDGEIYDMEKVMQEGSDEVQLTKLETIFVVGIIC